MKVWILMYDSCVEYTPDVHVWGVYHDPSYAGAEKCIQEVQIPDYRFWIEEWEVE